MAHKIIQFSTAQGVSFQPQIDQESLTITIDHPNSPLYFSGLRLTLRNTENYIHTINVAQGNQISPTRTIFQVSDDDYDFCDSHGLYIVDIKPLTN